MSSGLPLYIIVCPTISFEGIELLSTWMLFLWLNVENLKECFGSLERRSVHGHSSMRLGREFENVKIIKVLNTQYKVLEITLEC